MTYNETQVILNRYHSRTNAVDSLQYLTTRQVAYFERLARHERDIELSRYNKDISNTIQAVREVI